MGYLVLVLGYILSFLSFNTHSQQAYTALLWPISEKLGQQTILSVLQAADGTLWIATLAGIDRYNGVDLYEYRIHKPQEGHIPSSQILEIMESTSGEIYAATTDSGLLLFRERENRFVQVILDAGLQANTGRATAAYSSPGGELWIGYERGNVVRYSPDSHTVGSIRLNSDQKITGLEQARDGEMLAASANGKIFRISSDLHIASTITLKQSCLDRFSELGKITAAEGDSLWLATRGNGPLLLDMATGNCGLPESDRVAAHQLHRAVIHDIHYDPLSRSVLIGSDQGLYNITSRLSVTRIATKSSRVSDAEVVSITRGNGDVFWVGTYAGLNFLVPTVFETHADLSSGKLHSVVAIDSLADSGVWIASYEGKLFRDRAANDHQELDDILPESVLANGNIMTITVEAQGLWIGYRATGLQYVPFADVDTPHFWRTGERSSLSSNSVSAILPHEEGRTLIGTYGGGVNVVSLTGDTDVFPVGDNHVIFLHRTGDGTILAGTESGLYRFDVDTGHAVELKLLEAYGQGHTKPVVWDLVETNNGDTWLATMHHGLFVSKNEISKAISERSFVPVTGSTNFCSIAYAIEVDNQGYIWCSTNSALVRIDPTSYEARVFTRSHGLQLSEFDFGASHKDKDGHLYFGGSEGYVKFDPRSINPIQNETVLAFTSIKFPGSSIQSMSRLRDTNSVQLTHKDEFIQFEFSVMDLVDPENNQYRYRLEGFDQAWVENGNRNSATYTSLPAGRYTLRVQGANSAGVWNREGLSIEVEVLPSPWRTWRAYTFYALASLFVLWLFLRTHWSFALQRKSQQQARQMLEAEQHADDEMQEQLEIHDELVKSVYRHSVSTLGLVAELISTKGANLADETACEAMQSSVSRVDALAMLEECLYYQGEVLLADLNKYTNILVSRLLKHAYVGAENITTTNDVTSRPFPVAQASPLAIVLFEAIENAIQYAFEDTSRVNYLHITLGPDQADDPDANFRLVVRDNGPGIPSNIDPMSAPSSGLLIIASMARRLRGTFRVVNNNGTVLNLIFPRDLGQ